MSIEKIVELTNVKCYYMFASKPDEYGKHSMAIALTKNQVKQLLEEGLSEKVSSPKGKIMDRFRIRQITEGKDADKRVLHEGYVLNISKKSPIQVQVNGEDFTGIVGNGSTCDVLIGLNRDDAESELSPKPMAIKVTDLVEYVGKGSAIKSFFGTSDRKTKAEQLLEEAKNGK